MVFVGVQEHRADLYQFQRSRGIKVSDNSSPRTPPANFTEEEYDDEVCKFELPPTA